jgi:hypothetical protein
MIKPPPQKKKKIKITVEIEKNGIQPNFSFAFSFKNFIVGILSVSQITSMKSA